MTPNNQTTQGDLSADPIGFSLHVQTPGHNGISTDHMEISIPGANITHTPYSSIVESVIDGHFFINRDKALLKRDILETITDVVILLGNFELHEIELIVCAGHDIIDGYNGDCEMSPEFKRAYEGFHILKEVQLILTSAPVDFNEVASKFRIGMETEPGRNNILGLLHQAVATSCGVIEAVDILELK